MMEPRIIIVSIANGDPDLLSARTVRTIKESRQLVLRTSHSPVVSWLNQEKKDYLSLDDLYEAADDFDQLASMISDRLWTLAKDLPIVYAVSDPMTDASVRLLYDSKPQKGRITLIPGTGLSDIYHSAVLPLLSGSDLRMVSAIDFMSADYNPNISLLITELDNPVLTGEVKIRLSSFIEDERTVFFLHADAPPVGIPLYELDRQADLDHLSAVLVAGSDYLDRSRFVFDDLLHIMERLRSHDGCPWDCAQTHQSLRPYMIEEAWECIASIDQQDTDHLYEELGDLLFQVVFHASIGNAYDEFTINDVVSSICAKMIRRHPHVFSSEKPYDPDSIRISWEKIKQEETGHLSVVSSLDDVSTGLPSLIYAEKVLKKLSATSIVHSDTLPVLNSIRRIINQLSTNPTESDCSLLGSLLLLCAELCFIFRADSELLLHKEVDRLKSGLKSAENMVINSGKSLEHLTFDELGVYLKYVKDEIE